MSWRRSATKPMHLFLISFDNYFFEHFPTASPPTHFSCVRFLAFSFTWLCSTLKFARIPARLAPVLSFVQLNLGFSRALNGAGHIKHSSHWSHTSNRSLRSVYRSQFKKVLILNFRFHCERLPRSIIFLHRFTRRSSDAWLTIADWNPSELWLIITDR